MIYRNALLFTCWTLIYGQPLPAPPGIDVGALTDQARRFAERRFFFTSFSFFVSIENISSEHLIDVILPAGKTASVFLFVLFW